MTEHPDLPYEKAKNAEYIAHLKRKSKQEVGVSGPRSQKWVAPGGIKLAAGVSFHPLVGRLGFDAPDEFLGRSCYIGPSRLDEGDFQVLSWDAPASQLFFGSGNDGFTIDGELAVRRTFDHHVEDIADVDDEWLIRMEPSPFEAGQLQVPAPKEPGSPRRRRAAPKSTRSEQGPHLAPPRGQPAEAHEVRVSPKSEAIDGGGLAPPASQIRGGKGEVAAGTAGMRAADTVLKKLAAPRTAALRSVLATLQPDQYEVVSSNLRESLFVQGHPGTGKTVIAAYRAAFLVGAERGEDRAESVLLVGPTSNYVNHVRDLIRPLDPEGRVAVTHIAHLLAQTVGLKVEWSGGIGGEHNDIDARARIFAARSEAILRARNVRFTGPTAKRDHVEAIYSLIRSNGVAGTPIARNGEEARWIDELPRFSHAMGLRRFLPLMAQITLAFQPVPLTDQFEHLLIDEAQDVSPIEWNVLEQYLRPQGSWTLVGDMNQRRSDATYATWGHISDHLGLGVGDHTLAPTVLQRGYRSTLPILRFADKLLPAAQRNAHSIQTEGPRPTVSYVAKLGRLPERAVDEARRLIHAYPHGTVAMITVDPVSVIQFLGKHGWLRGKSMHQWERDGCTVHVYVPEDARGLEFDGVVVVEPGAFPENLGREGQLYTSLTRANRELAVVWHRDLPDALRRAARNGRKDASN